MTRDEYGRPGIRFLIWLAVVLVFGLLLFTYRHLEEVVDGSRKSPLVPLVNEMTAAMAIGLLYFGVRALVSRRPLQRHRWLTRLPLYGIALLAFAAAHTSLMWGSRELLYPLMGLGDYDYGAMPLRYLMELPMQAIAFAAIVGVLQSMDLWRAARRRELRQAQLEGGLARAELRALRLQLQPHFLFNALNTISVTMYRDPAAADEMIDQLAELLRASLRTAHQDEVPLAEELRVLDLYLGLMRARFGERLVVKVDVAPGVEDTPVPSMLLQPLVENAIRHGKAERDGRGQIEIRATVVGERLRLEVRDDGDRTKGQVPAAQRGIGLSATAERLRLLHGDEHGFTAGHFDGGFQVAVEVPLRRRHEGAA